MNMRINPDTLPWSAEAEQSVLGGLLLDNRAFDAAGPLSERQFFDPRHAAIWSAIAQLCIARKPADVITVWQVLKDAGKAEECGGLPYLNSLAQSVPSAANMRRYAEIVREKAAQRALMQTADEALTIAGERGSVGEKIDRIATKFSALQRDQVRKVPRSIADIAIQRTEYYEAVENGTVLPGWRTHIGRLNDLLNGGLRAGNQYVIAARPSVGKSSFSQAVGIAQAREGKRVLFLSQEMGESEVADRGVANVGRISYGDLLTGKLEREGWERVTEAMDELARLPFFIDDQPALSLADVRAKAMQVKPDVLIVDYLQLCAGSRRDGNRNSEIEEISRGLKALAKELNMAVLVLSQLNRKVEERSDRRPSLADLRDSGAIEQDADVVIFLWPVRECDDGRRLVGCGVEKNRQGRLGQFGLDFYGDLQQWGESGDDIRPEGGVPSARRKRTFDE